MTSQRTAIWMLAIAAGAALVASPPAAATPITGLANSAWPCFGQNAQHTGRSPYAGPTNPRVLWKYKGRNRLFSAPAVGPVESGKTLGDVYLGHSQNPVCRIDAETGAEMWCTTPNKGPSADRSGPAVGADGSVYIGARDNDLWWTRGSDGKVLDTFHVPTDGDVTTSPIVATVGGEDLILMGSDSLSAGYFYGMRKRPGPVIEPEWLNIIGGGVRNESPALSHDGQIVYVTSAGKDLNAIDVSTGIHVWKVRLETRGNGGARAPNFTPVVGADGTIYVGFDKGLFAMKPNGTIKWLFTTTPRRIFSPPAIAANGRIFVVAAKRQDGMIFALTDNGTSATQVWSHPVRGRMVNTAPIVDANGVVYLGADRTLYAFDPNGNGQGGGKIKWERKFAKRVFDSSPIIGGPGRIYIGSRDTFLYALGD
jgi:outer membrane protein assembly factor BamB